MQEFEDNVDASINKLRAIFQQGFKVVKSSQLQSDKKDLVNEITNEILQQIEEYLVDINNVTIDQVCGRIENKIENFDIYDVQLDDDSLTAIKKCIDENINVVNKQNETINNKIIESEKIIENNNADVINGEQVKTDNSYISPGQQIAQSLSLIGLQQKLDELSNFFNKDNKNNIKTVKNKNKKKDESLLSRLSNVLTFPLKLFKIQKAPAWLNTDLVSPMFFEILEDKIYSNLGDSVQKTIYIAKSAVNHNRHLLRAFDAERKINEKIAEQNRKLAKENRSLAFDLLTSRLIDVFKQIKNNVLDTFGNLWDTLKVFKDIVFTIIDMFLFMINIIGRIISLSITFLIHIFSFSAICIVDIFILLFQLLLVTLTFIVATLFVVGMLLITGIVITALFLAALAVILLASLVVIAIIAALGAITIMVILAATFFISITITMLTVLFGVSIILLSMLFNTIMTSLSFVIALTAAVLADIIVAFANLITIFIPVITFMFGLVISLTITIFTFFALILVTTLMLINTAMLRAGFIILSIAFLTISTMYAVAIAALAFSLIILSQAIAALGTAINLTALLVLLILFSIIALIVYVLFKAGDKLRDWLIKTLDEHKDTINDIVFKYITPFVDYINTGLDKFLNNTESIVNLQQKIDDWLKSTPEELRNEIVLAVRGIVEKMLVIAYNFVKNIIQIATDQLKNIVDTVFAPIFNNSFLNWIVSCMHALVVLDGIGDKQRDTLVQNIENWHAREMSIALQWTANELKRRGIVKDRYWWNLAGKALDGGDYLIRGRGVLDEGIDRVEGLRFINRLLFFLPNSWAPSIIAPFAGELINKFREGTGIPEIRKLSDFAAELKQSEIDAMQKEFDEIFEEADKEAEKILEEQLTDLENRKQKCQETLARIDQKLASRTNIVTLNTSNNNENKAVLG